jgi:hypothetical protein
MEMLVTSSRFAEAQKPVRVKLLIDQKVQGLALSKGDIAEVPGDVARRLIRMERAESVKPGDVSEFGAPKKGADK